MTETSRLVISTPDGEHRVNFGGIALSRPDIVPVVLNVENRTNRRHCISFFLSKHLNDVLSIQSVHEISSSEINDENSNYQEQQPVTDPSSPSSTTDVNSLWNVNLLHWDYQSSQEFDIPPWGVSSFYVHLAASTKNSAVSRVLSSGKISAFLETKKCSGQIFINDCENSEVAASIDVHGFVGDSWLKPDKDMLDLGRCSVNVWVYSEFTVHNLTDIPTQICLSTDFPTGGSNTEQPDLCFFDATSDQVVDPSQISIPPDGSAFLKVGLLSPVPGNDDRWFSVQNLRNSLDVWYVRVIADATAECVAERLLVSCGAELDFGHCYANCFTSRDILLKNHYPETLTVSLLSDRQNQVSYEVLQDADDSAMAMSDDVNLFSATVPIQPGQSSYTSKNATSQHLDDIMDAFKLKPEMKRQQSPPPRNRLAERVTLRPAQTRRVRVWYLPHWKSRDHTLSSQTANEDPGRLRPQNVQLVFRLPTGETRSVAARAQVCESVLRLARSAVHLGNCDVLVTYENFVTIMNCSDLPTMVTISYVSQCVRAETHEFIIDAHDTYALKLTFVPRQVNPSYHKDITFTNLGNPLADGLVYTLGANCVDRQGISLHALFYKILAPNPTNEVDFGTTVAHHTAIRAFRVRNESARRLVLCLENEPGVSTFVPANALPRATWVAQRLLGHNGVHALPADGVRPLPRFDYDDKGDRMDNTKCNYRTAVSLLDPGVGCDYLPTRCVASHDQIDALERACSWAYELEVRERGEDTKSDAWAGDQMTELEDVDGSDVADLEGCEDMGGEDNWTELLLSLDRREGGLLKSMPTVFSNEEAELRYMKRQLLPQRRLETAVRDGFLSKTNTISIKAGGEALVVTSLTLYDEDMRGNTKLRSIEKKLVVRMLEYDEGRLEEADSNGLRIQLSELREMAQCRKARELVLTARACKSVMSVAPLRQLNFGAVRVGEQKDKVFTIVNLSEAPLLYKIDKAGVDTHNELRLNVGRRNCSVVRPYSSKMVPFIYAPCISGHFEHRFIVDNVLDKSASCEVVVKATVKH